MNHKMIKFISGLVVSGLSTLAIAGYHSSQGDDAAFSVNVPGLNIHASFKRPERKDFHWVNMSAGQPIPRLAVIGGHENGHPLFVCHANFNGGVHPGKLVGDTCNISWGGREQLLNLYQVLVSNYPLGWVKASSGFIPGNAIRGGRENGHPLFICQAEYFGGVHTGKVVGNACNIGYGGKEIPRPFYRVLTS